MENGDNRQQKSSNSKKDIAQGQLPTASALIREADEFTQKWNTNDIIVDYEKAKPMKWITVSRYETNWLGRPKQTKEDMCNVIGDRVASYQLARDAGSEQERYNKAFELIGFVQKARAFGLFKDLARQQRDYEQEIENLKERINSLLKLNTELALENKRLHNLLPNPPKRKGDTEVGEVTE